MLALRRQRPDLPQERSQGVPAVPALQVHGSAAAGRPADLELDEQDTQEGGEMSSRDLELVEVWRPVIGLPDQVRTALETAWIAGRLVTCKPPQRLAPGKIKVMALLREPGPAPPWWRQPSARGALVAAGLAVVGALVWLAVWAVTWLVAWIAAHIVGIAVIGSGIVFGLLWLISSGKCPGLHCSGCKG
jgi:hypothetical protein